MRVCVRVCDLCDLLVLCTVFARVGYGKGKKRQYRIYLHNENTFFFPEKPKQGWEGRLLCGVNFTKLFRDERKIG